MASTETITVASISANADNASRDGTITREGSRYIVTLSGQRVGQDGSLEGAAHRLANLLRRELGRGSSGAWGVLARCALRADVALAFGNMAGGGNGGTGAPNPCVGRVIAEYGRGPNEFERALQFAARLISDCCVS